MSREALPVVLRVVCSEPEMLQDWEVDNINTKSAWGSYLGHSHWADRAFICR